MTMSWQTLKYSGLALAPLVGAGMALHGPMPSHAQTATAPVLSEHRITTQIPGRAIFILQRETNGLPAGTRLVTEYSFENRRFIACLQRAVLPNGAIRNYTSCAAAIEPLLSGRDRTRVSVYENFIEIHAAQPLRLTWGMPVPTGAPAQLKVPE